MQEEQNSAVLRVTARLRTIIAAVKNGELPTENGVSLLDAKCHVMLDYFSYYAYYLLAKSLQLPIEGSAAVDQLISLRVHLEKMKPLEAKIKYQIDKLVKSALNVVSDANPLSFKPNLMDLQPANTPLDAAGDEEETEQTATYKPPKIAPMYFKESSVSKSTLLTTQQLEKASRSRLLTEMRSQFSRLPEELTSHGTGYAGKSSSNANDEKWQARQEFEEANFMRLNLTREDKKLQRAVEKGAGSRFNDEFGNLEEDFKELGGVRHAVGLDEIRGTRGVLRKAEGRGDGVEKYVAKEARGAKREMGKDEYEQDKKKFKTAAKRAKAKLNKD